jgi:hypothetical protein
MEFDWASLGNAGKFCCIVCSDVLDMLTVLVLKGSKTEGMRMMDHPVRYLLTSGGNSLGATIVINSWATPKRRRLCRTHDNNNI